MKSRLSALKAPWLAALALLASVTPASAAVIDPSSSYGIYLWGTSSGQTFHDPISFDGNWESFTRTTVDGNDIGLRINESESDLGGGLHLIEIIVMADADLFPVGGETIFFNVGELDPLNVLGNYLVESALLSIYVGDTLQNQADFYQIFPHLFTEPWDGGFLSADTGGGWSNGGALGINQIRLQMTVREMRVPTPATLAVMALGLCGLFWQRQRQTA